MYPVLSSRVKLTLAQLISITLVDIIQSFRKSGECDVRRFSQLYVHGPAGYTDIK